MKRKTTIAAVVIALFAVAVIALRPYVAVVADPDFGVAVSVRSSIMHKFEPLFTWRFQ